MASIEIVTVPTAVYESQKDRGCKPEMAVVLDHDAHVAFGVASNREETQKDYDDMSDAERHSFHIALAFSGGTALYESVQSARRAEEG